MSKFWSPFVKDLVPYVPGEQPKLAKLVKLNTNENPYGPSPKAIAAMQAEVGDNLRLYPDPNSDRLKQAGLRQREHRTADREQHADENQRVGASDERRALRSGPDDGIGGKGKAHQLSPGGGGQTRLYTRDRDLGASRRLLVHPIATEAYRGAVADR